jgi:manganese efflux pump family protein
MSTLTILGIAVGLAMDAFAVSVAGSITLRSVSPRQIFRFAFHFGLFQAMMPVLGWLAGSTIQQYIESWDHWIAFALLGFVGGKAIIDALSDGDENNSRQDPTRGWSLVILSIATSIDALAVGLSLAMIRVEIWYPAIIIGIVTATLSICGMLLGSRIGRRFNQRIEILGGIILIAIGVKILIEHGVFN